MSDRGNTAETGSSAAPESVTGVTECAACGTRFAAAAWHPVTTRVEDREFRRYAFCCADCRDAWRDDR